MTGDTNCMGLCSGFLFELENHYRSDFNNEYLITRVEHEGSQGAGFATTIGDTSGHTYSNIVTCIPNNGTPYRPPRLTPKPNVPGIMTARNETAGGDYAYLDEDGSYRTKMHFDRLEQDPATHSRPIRMAQPYSGPGYGIHFPNHADTEMVWACVNGDPDRPLALSTAPNPSNTSPSLAANNFQNIIRSMGQNELRFDDTIGDEEVYMNATYDTRINTNNDKDQTTGNNETLTIGNDRTKTIGNDETNTIKHDRTTTIHNNETQHVGNNRTRTVGNNEKITIDSNRDKIVKGNQSEKIIGNKSIKVIGGHKETIIQNMTQTVTLMKKV
ncbi:MAG: hypothetical protein GY869_31210, partial [Planctomycetes bacterium]|nr:hypothetical protein [Planctomycetota bacterium]